MKPDVGFPPLLTAARALQHHTTPRDDPNPCARILRLHAHGATLTVGATNGTEHAQVDLPAAVSDGHTAVAPAALIGALTAMKPTRHQQRHAGHPRRRG